MTGPEDALPSPLVRFDGVHREWNAARLGATSAERIAALIALGEQALTELDNAIIADMEAGEAQ